ncbi:MAG: transcriptional repressor LexA [Anaerovoracaceae bacterium]
MRSKSPEIMTRIKDYVEEFYFENSSSPSIREIARGVGIGSTTVFRYLQEMSEKGMLLYDGESVTTEKIKKMKTGSVSIPIVGSIACGIPNLAEENIEEYIQLPEVIFGRGRFYILRASGSSMIEVGINDGDLVVIREQCTAEDGNIVVALVGEEATLKRFHKEGDHIRLHPENRDMDDIIVSDCQIQGVAVKVIKDLL